MAKVVLLQVLRVPVVVVEYSFLIFLFTEFLSFLFEVSDPQTEAWCFFRDRMKIHDYK